MKSEQSLLFDQARVWFWRAGRTGVIGRTAEQLDHSVCVQSPKIIAVDTLQIRAREFPSLNPKFPECNLLWCPTGKSGSFLLHVTRIIEYTTVGKHRRSKLRTYFKNPGGLIGGAMISWGNAEIWLSMRLRRLP